MRELFLKKRCSKSMSVALSIYVLSSFLIAAVINVPVDYSTIQSGINAAVDGDTVLVQSGTYVENINFNGHNIVVGSLFLTTQDTSYISSTIIDGNQNGSTVTITNGEDTTCVITGFTIKNGSGTLVLQGENWVPNGGGIYILDSSPIVDYCIIDSNYCHQGSGIYFQHSYAIVCNCSFSNNWWTEPIASQVLCPQWSGVKVYSCSIINNNCNAISSYGGSNIFQDLLITHNYYGGAFTSNDQVINTKIVENDGGIVMRSGQIVNSVISGNGSVNGGNGIMLYNGSPVKVINCTITNNAQYGIYNRNTVLSVLSSIIYDNISGSIDTVNNPTINISYTDIAQGWSGDGNIDVPPQFVDTTSGDFRLLASSLCINAGHPDSTDSDGTRTDMGAYPYLNSYSGPNWYVTTTGNDTSGTGSVDNPFASIQAGINFASDGDSVSVSSGTYSGTINFLGKDIKVFSVEGSDVTILDGEGAFNIVTFANGETRAAVLDGFTIQNGRSDWAAYHTEGGIYITGSSPTIKNCIIQDCEQYYYGSAIGIWNNSDPLLDGLIIRNNLGYHGGGLAILNNSTATLQNSLIYNNHATGTGGGIYSDLVTTSMQIINCTIVSNVSDGLYNQFWGGGVYAWKDSTVEIVNSIFWDNLPNQIQDENDLLTSVKYSNIQGGYSGTGNIDINPQFVDTTNNNYALLASSPCINAGHPDSTDSDGTHVDMGAFPYLNTYSGPDWYVITTGNDISGTGELDNPFASIQAGINFSSNGDSVKVHQGTYSELIDFREKSIALIGINGSTNTIIDAGGIGRPLTLHNQSQITQSITGFTLQNGSEYLGGGIKLIRSNIVLFDIHFVSNAASYQGGGLYCEFSNIAILKSKYSNNSATNGGGGIYLYESSMIGENIVSESNSSSENGGSIHLHTSEVSLNHCTLVSNQASLGPAVYSRLNSRLDIFNSILWDNEESAFYQDIDTSITISYSDIQGGFEGTGNLDINPYFVNVAESDYRLLDYSPCLGAGLDTSIVPITDIEGNPRPNPPGSNPDMGAHENSRTTQIVVDSLGVIHGDTALVGVEINLLNGSSYSAIDISFNGFQGLLDFIGLVSDSALFGQHNWTTAVNETDTLLITASAGADDITSSGTLFWLKFAVPDTLPSQFVPINILSAILNTDSIATGLIDGGIQVLWSPDAGFEGTPTSGSYPLSVTYTDTSLVGTYPINLWIWDLGYGELDTSQNITHTYDRPGDYTVSLMIRDEYGLSDTATKQDYINIPFIHGDIDFNTNVQSYDAALILKHLVGYITLDSLQLTVGNVSSDTTFSALDATLILQWVVGLIDSLPYVDTSGVFLATGDVYMENIAAAPGVMVDIPVMIENGINIYSFEGEIAYNTEHLQLDTLIFSDLLEGFFAEVYDDSGIVQMAGAGANSDGEEGIFALLRFVVSPDYDFDSTVVSLNKLRWNEGSVVEDVASMILTVQLGVDSKLVIPDKFALHQNYPNPWNPITTISYDVPTQSPVTIIIYDILGRQVRTLIEQISEPGYRSVVWDATNDRGQSVGAGVYLYRIQAGDYLQTKKMILIK